MTLSCKSWTSAFWTFPVGSEHHYNRTLNFIMLKSIQEVEFDDQKFVLVTNLILWQEKLWHTVQCKEVNLKLKKLRTSTKLWDVMQMYKCKFTETAALVKHCLRYLTKSFSDQVNKEYCVKYQLMFSSHRSGSWVHYNLLPITRMCCCFMLYREHIKGFCSYNIKTTILRQSLLWVLAIRIMLNPVHTYQFILLFSTTCFGLKGHQVEHNNTRMQWRTEGGGLGCSNSAPPPSKFRSWHSCIWLQIERKMFSVPIPTS